MPIKVTLDLFRNIKSKDFKLKSGKFIKRFQKKKRRRVSKIYE